MCWSKVRELSYDLTTLRGSGLAQNLRMSGSHNIIQVKSYNTHISTQTENQVTINLIKFSDIDLH